MFISSHSSVPEKEEGNPYQAIYYYLVNPANVLMLVSLQGLVYVDKHVLGWRPLAQSWLEGRSKEEILVLQKVFNKTLDPICAFVFNESRYVSLNIADGVDKVNVIAD